MNEDTWQQQYAASTLRARLQKMADEHGEQVLETRADAWPRLLATWRAVLGGVEHGNMRMAPYGGSLFDPDRYPFLEGRLPGTSWQNESANPLPVDNRTVLHLLSALQTLREGAHRRKLSFRGLDVEQIGHVYEGMLDHTADRAEGWVLGLSGRAGKEPEIPLDELEALNPDELVDLLKDRTGRDGDMIERWLEDDPGEEVESRFGTRWSPAFGGDTEAAERIERFAKFLREDSFGAPTVFAPGSVYVCDSSHRGATGTHYTPRSFTEEMVRETLDPLVYDGIAEGKPEDDWQLRKPDDILALNVGDPACGSGAFLVQSCRYLSTKLVESRKAWSELDHDPTEDDLIHARREVASRCLYGVDVNPMAAEMAKLSLWLVTLERDKPFSFLDHAIGVGDSLVGLTSPDQLRYWDLSGDGAPQEMITGIIGQEVEEALDLRATLEATPALDIQDVDYKQRLLNQSKEATARLRALADLLFSSSLASDKAGEVAKLRDEMLHFATRHLEDDESLQEKASELLGGLRPFHWVLEFPEVFEGGGFDAIVGNPPYMGGQRITGVFGEAFREYLVEHVADGLRGSADLVAYFFRRAEVLLAERGFLGFLATKSVATGATNDVGLAAVLTHGYLIYRARHDLTWPGAASGRVSMVHLTTSWRGSTTLDGAVVPAISPALTRARPPTHKLKANDRLCYVGSYWLGDGFVLDRSERRALIQENSSSAEVIFQLVIGEDLNQLPGQASDDRWIISFWDWSLEQAEAFPAALKHVREHVKPVRDKVSRKTRRERWWQFAELSRSLYHGIGRGGHFERRPRGWDEFPEAPMSEVIVTAQTSKYLRFSWARNDVVFSQTVFVFTDNSAQLLAVLNSSCHAIWVRAFSGDLGVTLRYNPSRCLLNFPLPRTHLAGAGRVAEEQHRLHANARAEWETGLTDVYNRVHDEASQHPLVDSLRAVQTRLDQKVLQLYGWDDIELDHDFRDVPYLPENDRHRYTISEEARLEILDRLGQLNRERYEEEVTAGLHNKKGKKKRAATKKKPKPSEKSTVKSQASLFDEGEGSA